ncbi:MAG TPA: hypothetical protein VG099_30735 [Gemmataceae bacterium]|nr:hypothetical protein [Gemmataceae bacterium]
MKSVVFAKGFRPDKKFELKAEAGSQRMSFASLPPEFATIGKLILLRKGN